MPEDDTLQNHRCENLKSYISNNNFYENLLSCSQVVSCGQTDMAKLIGAFLQFFVTSMAERSSPPVAVVLIGYVL
jgi:hypothetical protein